MSGCETERTASATPGFDVKGNDSAMESQNHRQRFALLVIVTAVLAVILQSALFHTEDWMVGDLAYHRAVAYSMLGGDLQGAGPFSGLISYFGGLFPLLVALLVRALRLSFETVISYLSWGSPILLVAAFATLGRTIWRCDVFRAGLVVVFGATAGALSLDSSNLWVDGVLPGLHNYWPAYPRDFALGFIVLASALALQTRSRWAFATGVSVGIAFLFHAQIGAIGVLIVAAIWTIRVIRRTRTVRGFLSDVLMASFAFTGLTFWWILPRVQAAIRGGLHLQSFPRANRLDLPSLSDYGTLFGVVGLIALLGVFRSALGGTKGWSERLVLWIAGWLIVSFPLAVVATVGGDLGVVTSRRSWLILSPALIVLAADTMAWLTDHLSRQVSAALVALVVVLAVVPAAVGTIPYVRDVWNIGEYQGRVLDVGEWTHVWEYLRSRISEGDAPELLASDALSGAAWSWSGTHVASMTLPGYVKVGFDLQSETGWSYLDRVEDVDRAFQRGLHGLCDLATQRDIPYVLLEEWNGLLATRDVNPASKYRVDPESRSFETVSREVGEGIRYRDSNAFDSLSLSTGATFELPDWAKEVEAIDIELLANNADQPVLSSRQNGSPEWLLTVETAGFNRLSLPLNPSGGQITLEALQPISLMRIVGYEDAGNLATPLVGIGLVLYDRGSLCRK